MLSHGQRNAMNFFSNNLRAHYWRLNKNDYFYGHNRFEHEESERRDIPALPILQYIFFLQLNY